MQALFGAVAVVDAGGGGGEASVCYASDGFLELLGYELTDIITQDVIAVLSGALLARLPPSPVHLWGFDVKWSDMVYATVIALWACFVSFHPLAKGGLHLSCNPPYFATQGVRRIESGAAGWARLLEDPGT